MALLVAGLFLAVFTANVVLGSAGHRPFLTDVQEMLVLWAATIAFVVAILQREARETARNAAAPGTPDASGAPATGPDGAAESREEDN